MIYPKYKILKQLGKNIKFEVLMRLYRIMERSPMKIFMMSDFHFSSKSAREYLNVLVEDDMIERLNVKWYWGNRNGVKYGIGYRLKRRVK